jgi:hypothetical protein
MIMLLPSRRLTCRAAPCQRLRDISHAYPQRLGYLTDPLAIVRRREHPARADPANKPCPAGTASLPSVHTQPEIQESHTNPRFGRPIDSSRPEVL